jgi:hypothetical protein
MARPPLIILVIALVVCLVSIFAAFILAPSSACRDFNAGIITYDNKQQLSVALARTTDEHQQGLSGCSSVPPGHGMYFIFPVKTDISFWMKGMKIPIDIVWLSDNKVIGITADVPPPTSPQAVLPLYPAPAPVDAVLEIGAGEAQKLKIHQGSIFAIEHE